MVCHGESVLPQTMGIEDWECPLGSESEGGLNASGSRVCACSCACSCACACACACACCVLRRRVCVSVSVIYLFVYKGQSRDGLARRHHAVQRISRFATVGRSHKGWRNLLTTAKRAIRRTPPLARYATGVSRRAPRAGCATGRCTRVSRCATCSVPQTAEEPRARLDEPNVSHNDFAFGIA